MPENTEEYPKESGFRVSVIIPVYNRQDTIEKTINSVLSQSEPVYEVIVVDDGSKDGTRQVIEANFSETVTYIYQDNQGASSARNLGINSASGDWIAFLDSDDEWLEEKVRNDMNLARSDSDVDFIHSNRKQSTPDGSVDNGRVHLPASDFKNKKYILNVWALKTSTVMIRKDLLETLDHYFSTSLRTCEDYEFFWRAVISSNKVGYSEEPSVIIYLSDDGISRNEDKLRIISDNLAAINSALKWCTRETTNRKDLEKALVKRTVTEGIKLCNAIIQRKNPIYISRSIWTFRAKIGLTVIAGITYLLFARRWG